MKGDLTVRELQVLTALGSGLRVSEIARTLRLSVKTVSTYRVRALDKLIETGAIAQRSNIALIRYALQTGLVS